MTNGGGSLLTTEMSPVLGIACFPSGRSFSCFSCRGHVLVGQPWLCPGVKCGQGERQMPDREMRGAIFFAQIRIGGY